YTFSISAGALPTGLSLNGSTGAISGTPTVAGTGTFTVHASDSSSTAATGNQQFSIVVSANQPPPPGSLQIGPGSLPAATVGSAYSASVTASGGSSPYTFSISAGALPTGLSLNSSTGAISGTPTVAAISAF